MTDPNPLPDEPTPDSPPTQLPTTAEDQLRRDLTLDDGSRGTTPTGAPVQTMTGSSLGPYELLEMLGQGGMGAVFKAKHTRLNKHVAIKVLPTQFTQSVEALARFDREMKAVGALEHPNIVRAMDADEHLGTHYLVMEYVDGQDLQKFVKQHGPLEIGEACRLIRDAAHALQHAHEFNLIHRDIKPSNLLLTKSGQLKVLDLGLARLVGDSPTEEGLTTTGVSLGTPDYMAPEQWSDSHRVDFRTDLYALGCTLYFLLVGRPPFGTEQYRTVVGKLTAHTQAPIPPLRDVRPEVPPALDALYQRLMVKDATQRLGSATELIAAIEPFCTGPVNASAKTVAMVVPPAPTLGGAAQAASRTKPANPNSSRPAPPATGLPKVAVGAAALIAIAIFVMVLANFGKQSPTSDANSAYPPDPPPTIVPVGVPPLGGPDQPPPGGTQTGWHGWPADAPPPAIAPFNAEQAKAHQKAWADYLKVPVEYENSIGMTFVLIPPGEFEMGTKEKEVEHWLPRVGNDEHARKLMLSSTPAHRVVLLKPIYVAAHETTQGDYKTITGSSPSRFRTDDSSSNPVEQVTWHDATEFCEQLSLKDKLSGGYCLPSEAQWEFTCRAGTDTEFHIGDDPEETRLSTAAWWKANGQECTHPVGTLNPNAFGMHDMHGNVVEWCSDRWSDEDYRGMIETPAINPSGANEGTAYVVRGGSHGNYGIFCRSSSRDYHEQDESDHATGFRVALSVDAVKELLARKRKIASGKSWHGWPADAPAPAIAPFNAEQAKAHQKAWADYLKVPVEYENSIGMKFVLIPPGEFEMGSTSEEIEAMVKAVGGSDHWKQWIHMEAPKHRTIIAQPYFAGIHEVTQSQYQNTAGRNPSHFARTGAGKEAVAGFDTKHHPVGLVSWNDAADFCLQLTKTEQLKPAYSRGGNDVAALAGNGYRLLSEAEWECAARAGTQSAVWSGQADESLLAAAWFIKNSGNTTHPVGELSANQFGLYDTAGNAWEWVEDLIDWDNSYRHFATSAAIDPRSIGSGQHMLRGGCGNDEAVICRSAGPRVHYQVANDQYTGFRVALSVDAVKVLLAREKAIASSGTPNRTQPNDNPTATSPPTVVSQQLDEAEPLPPWKLPEGAPQPVVAPCKPAEATALQQEWAEFLKRKVVEEHPVGLKFALIPPGEFRKTFTRPHDPAITADMPVRRLRQTKPYLMSTTEVTWDQFRQFVEATSYTTEAETNGRGGTGRDSKNDPEINWRTPGWDPDPNEPVTQVTKRNAEAFCAWLSDDAVAGPGQSQATPSQVTPSQNNPSQLTAPRSAAYRLPTEAEWIHACRAGSIHKHVAGPLVKDLADYAWIKQRMPDDLAASSLHSVGGKKANPFGLHDMLGNVWEYTRDSMSPALVLYLSPSDPMGNVSAGIIGGGCDDPETVHPDWGYPSWATPTFNAGFRVVKQLVRQPLQGPLEQPLRLSFRQPLSVHALVPRPTPVAGLRSWSVELASTHSRSPFAIAANSKGDLIATASGVTGKISLYDREGKYLRGLLGHEGEVLSLDFSPDGKWLASCEVMRTGTGDHRSTARLWNLETGALHAVFPLGSWGEQVKFSPRGNRLAIVVDRYAPDWLMLLDLKSGRVASLSDGRAEVIDWSPDGSKIACATIDQRLRVIDAATLKPLREAAGGHPHWSPDGKWIATHEGPGQIAIRDAQTLEIHHSLDAGGVVIGWLSDSRRLAIRRHGKPSGVVDATSGEQLTTFPTGVPYTPIALLHNADRIVYEDYGRLHFIDTAMGKQLWESKERVFPEAIATLAPNGSNVIVGSGDSVAVHDAATGQRQGSFRISVPSPQFIPSPDGSQFAAKKTASIAVLVDAQTGATKQELLHGDAQILSMAWSPDGKWLATGSSDAIVRIWSTSSAKVVHELSGHEEPVPFLAWSPDGKRLGTWGDDKTIRIWEPATGKPVANFKTFQEAPIDYHEKAVRFSWNSNSRQLQIALNQHISTLDVETGAFSALENFSNGGNPVTFLANSPDGQRTLIREGYEWMFMRGRDASDRQKLGQKLGQSAQWHPDSRRFLGDGRIGFDVAKRHRVGQLFRFSHDQWLCIGPDGHYRGSEGVEEQIVYVAMLDDGSQRTYSPAEFAERFDWKNEPEKAFLLGQDQE